MQIFFIFFYNKRNHNIKYRFFESFLIPEVPGFGDELARILVFGWGFSFTTGGGGGGISLEVV